MALLQAVVIGLVALTIAPGYLFYFDITPKLVVMAVGTAAVLLCAASRRSGSVPAGKLFPFLLSLSLVSLALSAALSNNPALSVFGSNWRKFGALPQAAVLLFAWLVACAASGRPEQARTLLRGISAAGLLSAVYGIAQYVGWDPILTGSSYHIGEGIWTIVRPPATFGYVSYFATWLLFVIFFSLGLAESETSLAWRVLTAATATLSFVAMLLTGTRAAVLGVAAGGVVWFYWRGFRVPRRFLVTAAALAVAAVGFYFSPLGWQLRSRTRWFVEDPWGGARPLLWRDSLRMGLHRLAAGYGPEVFTAAFPKYETKELASAYPDFAHESPHNIFLDALVSQGIPGLVLLTGLCAVGFLAAWRLRASNPVMATCLAAALAAGIVSQQFTVFIIPTALMFYVTIALAVALAAEPVAYRRHAAFVAAAVAVSAAWVYFGVRVSLADRSLALTKRALESGDLQSAMDRYAQYRQRSLPGASSDLWYSRALQATATRMPNAVLQLRALVESGAAAQRATLTAEDAFNAWYNMAALHAGQNDAAGAERSLRMAIAANPNWFKPHWMLAQVLRLESRMEEAASQAALAVELDGGKNPEVARTLVEIRAQLHK